MRLTELWCQSISSSLTRRFWLLFWLWRSLSCRHRYGVLRQHLGSGSEGMPHKTLCIHPSKYSLIFGDSSIQIISHSSRLRFHRLFIWNTRDHAARHCLIPCVWNNNGLWKPFITRWVNRWNITLYDQNELLADYLTSITKITESSSPFYVN